MALTIHSFPLGPLQTNCHVLVEESGQNAVVVDPGEDAGQLLQFLRQRDLTVVAIWNTHAHFDHIGANQPLREATGAPIHIHPDEAEWLTSPMLCGAALFGMPFIPSSADVLWEDGEEFEALGCRWKVHHTPGHSPGSCVVICESEGVVVGGDLLFAGSIGRMDLPGGSSAEMTQSLRRFFQQLAQDHWKVLVGHGENTTVGRERKSNRLVQLALGPGLEHLE
jgi:glyoxylase-like metal-dependent hydrolase (beta-lactamase superfamily II)